jgi:hypothetical protein
MKPVNPKLNDANIYSPVENYCVRNAGSINRKKLNIMEF